MNDYPKREKRKKRMTGHGHHSVSLESKKAVDMILDKYVSRVATSHCRMSLIDA